uniref:Truncated MAT1-1-1 n=1 Tax=Leptographium profanum TaxID=1356864 RepID=S5TDE1_9PEZI|nr:truncated MAT1-1-1 [Leptographium profanum]
MYPEAVSAGRKKRSRGKTNGSLVQSAAFQAFKEINKENIEAAAELFSRSTAFHFDVLVVDDSNRVRQHVLCAMEPLGGNSSNEGNNGDDENISDSSKTFLVAGPATAHLAAQARAVAGPFSVAPPQKTSSSSSSSSSNNNNNIAPTYTQHMAYQTSFDVGQFHVFSSQLSGSSGNGGSGGHGHKDDNASEAETIVPVCEYAGDTDIDFDIDIDIDADINAEAWIHGGQPAEVADSEAMEYLEHVHEQENELVDGLSRGHGLLDLGGNSSLNGGVHYVDLVRGRTDAVTALGKHGHDQNSNSSTNNGSLPTAKRCRIYDDLQYLMGTMRQDETELRGQLARGQRPAVLANIHRGQTVAAMGGSDFGTDSGTGFGTDFSTGSHPARLGLAGYDFPIDGSGDDMLANFFAGGSSMMAGSAAAAAAQVIATASAEAADSEGMQFIHWPTN